MKVFWRPEPLTEPEVKLLNLCLEAHCASASRPNISTVVLHQAAVGSHNYFSALAAALCSIGGTHAPLQDTAHALMTPVEQLIPVIKAGRKIPGWGNSFEKHSVDPTWKAFRNHLSEHFPEISDRIEAITKALHDEGKKIYPNPSIFTVATAFALKLPLPVAGWLFVHGRLAEWTTQFFMALMSEMNPKPKGEPELEEV